MSEEKLKVSVDAEALYEVLSALNSRGPEVRELQVTRNPNGITSNPIDLLISEYNSWAERIISGDL